jgi:hypothetical protein
VQVPDNKAIAPERPPVRRKLVSSFVAADSYGLVLLLVFITYILAVSLRERRAPPLVVVAQIVTVWFALRTSKAPRRVRLGANVVLAAAAVIAAVDLLGNTMDVASPTILAINTVLYLIAPITIIRHLASRRTVDQETVLGAVAAYLLIGMFFAFLYRFLDVVQVTPFFGAEGRATMSRVLFFSFTTLTTTGYGNLVPAGNPGQTAAVAEMLIGQLFLITAVGKVITVWQPRRWSALDERPEDGEG